jgi:exodeoxyribonuclease-3
VKIKIATWNMAYKSHKFCHNESWNYFLNELHCDILLFQEAKPDYNLIEKDKLVWNPIGGTRPWGSGIYSKAFPIKEKGFKTTFFGAVTSAEVDISENISLIIVSLYGLMEKIFNVTYAIPNLHRIFSDLTGFIEGPITKHKMIIGGDFNASLQIDELQKGKSHKVFFDRLKEFQLENCFTTYYPDYIQTHRHFISKKSWQDDYFFISNHLFQNLKNCEVIDNDFIRIHSDHNPVLIELDV